MSANTSSDLSLSRPLSFDDLTALMNQNIKPSTSLSEDILSRWGTLPLNERLKDLAQWFQRSSLAEGDTLNQALARGNVERVQVNCYASIYSENLQNGTLLPHSIKERSAQILAQNDPLTILTSQFQSGLSLFELALDEPMKQPSHCPTAEHVLRTPKAVEEGAFLSESDFLQAVLFGMTTLSEEPDLFIPELLNNRSEEELQERLRLLRSIIKLDVMTQGTESLSSSHFLSLGRFLGGHDFGAFLGALLAARLTQKPTFLNATTESLLALLLLYRSNKHYTTTFALPWTLFDPRLQQILLTAQVPSFLLHPALTESEHPQLGDPLFAIPMLKQALTSFCELL